MGALAPVFGVLGGVAGVANTIPYVRDTVRGNTRPHRGSWLIWGILAIVACLAQLADHASWSALMTGTQAILTGMVFLLAVRYGEGGMSARELALIALASAGVIGWVLVRAPVVAVGCVIAADLIGCAMTVPKVRRDPHSETLSTYALASLGGGLATVAVGMLDVSLLLYPAYYCIVNAAMAILIHRQRALVAHTGPSGRAGPLGGFPGSGIG
jgi:hypothetical protein